jgi:hypothetical protein
MGSRGAGLPIRLLNARVASVTGFIACKRKKATASTNSSVPYRKTIRSTKRPNGLRFTVASPLFSLPGHLLRQHVVDAQGFLSETPKRAAPRSHACSLPYHVCAELITN